MTKLFNTLRWTPHFARIKEHKKLHMKSIKHDHMASNDERRFQNNKGGFEEINIKGVIYLDLLLYRIL